MSVLRARQKLVQAIEAEIEALYDEEDGDQPGAFDEENFIKAHIFDCLTLLASVQRNGQQNTPANLAGARAVRNKVFMGAVSAVGNSLLKVDGAEQLKQTNNAAVSNHLMKAFSVSEYSSFVRNERLGWLPLHWAVVLASSNLHNVTEADVKALYALDPMAMQTKHVTNVVFVTMGFNPAHLLCMSPVTAITMQLVRSFSLCSPTAFGSVTAVSALHVACGCGTPTVELLQHLLQLDSSQTKKNVYLGNRSPGHCPLGQLCSNLMRRADELTNADALVKCLLEVDKSVKVVGGAIVGCLNVFTPEYAGEAIAATSERIGRLYRLIETLLKAAPEAAKYRDLDSDNLLHWACSASLPTKLCIDLLKLVLAVHKDAVREAGYEDALAVHSAAKCADVEVLEFLLGLYPEAATALASDGANLLHWAGYDSDSSRAVPKVRYLCARYPAMIQQRDSYGNMAAHWAVMFPHYKTLLALYEAGGVEQFKTPVAHSARAWLDDHLPLHLFLNGRFRGSQVGSSFSSEHADMFRWLLRIYPEAAGIEGGVGADKKTPYQLAVDEELPDYYLRLLLRAAPTLNPPELHRLNYADRRMAMFLAFKSVTATLDAPVLVRLRGESKDLVQRVVSFL